MNHDSMELTHSIMAVCLTVVLVTMIVLGFQECSKRSREQFILQKAFVEHRGGSPTEAERVHPYPLQGKE